MKSTKFGDLRGRRSLRKEVPSPTANQKVGRKGINPETWKRSLTFDHDILFSDDWKYNDCSSSESDGETEVPPPSKRIGSKRLVPKKLKKTRYTSEDSSVDTDDDKRRGASRRTAATSISYKEESDVEKTDSEDLLEVEYQEAVEAIPEEKCETIERILAQRTGKKGGKDSVR